MNGQMTPARQQYLDLKAQHPDALLWFRLGDFYEMFDDDAKVAANALRITLTHRTFGKGQRVPMCGVPHHAYARFLARLVRQGHSVAICEQVGEVGRGIVDRQVVRVVTAGTISEPELLRAGENNYLGAVTLQGSTFALAYVDVSTGEFRVAETDTFETLLAELARLGLAECLAEGPDALPALPVGRLTIVDRSLWLQDGCRERLLGHLGARALHTAGCDGRPASIAAAGAILGYLERTNRALLNALHALRPQRIDWMVGVDTTTRAMLLGTGQGSERREGIHGLLDRTCTPIGARMLSRWIRHPIRGMQPLLERQEGIAELIAQGERRQGLRAVLRRVGDLERLTTRIAQERAAPEDFLALCDSLEAIPDLLLCLHGVTSALLVEALDDIDPAADIAAGVRAAVAEPGSAARIRPSYDPEIDRLAAAVGEAREQLAALERAERERTGIRSLKVGFNQVVGYYIEVTNPNIAKVPANYTRKQSMSNAERFVTPELLQWEAALAEAEAGLQKADNARYLALQRAVGAEAGRLLGTADALARVDVIAALAEVGELHGFVRPELEEGTGLEIVAGRHPLVERVLPGGGFIPNDCRLGGEHPHLAIVTGPNMGGKSTYLRQVALIVYLAQIGSFVPAAAARIGLVDRIFARIGAHDDLAAGQSTFLLEMAETAAIARLATPRSLVLLDEIGRGTTSADGLAIALAVAEHLHEIVAARTLFATHYSELARAAECWPGAVNLHVRAEEHEGSVVFLYRVTPGVADRSFALHVARMAGMPEPITLRAAELLANAAPLPLPYATTPPPTPDADPVPALDAASLPGSTAQPPPARDAPLPARNDAVAVQDTAVEADLAPPRSEPRALRRISEVGHAADGLAAELLRLDLAATTPIEALNALFALQQWARALHGQGADGQAREQRGYQIG